MTFPLRVRYPRKAVLPACGLLPVLALAACVQINVHGTPDPRSLDPLPGQIARVVRETLPPVRFATYNTSLYSDEDGGLVKRLQAGDEAARKIAAVLQHIRPDVVLLNEFDYDPSGGTADLFQRDYLGVGQPGSAPIVYPYRYLAPVNTGVQSGYDLDRDGQVGGQGRARGNDAWGYGLHSGQYGMLVLSRYPIDLSRVRTFRTLKWSAMPDARVPRVPGSGVPWYPEATWREMPLSSKSHWDIPLATPQGVIHLLASHPTPPTFDGAEDRNGLRNADEIRLWAEYVSGRDAPWLCDDRGHCGGLPAAAPFVIVGDLNADPDDGDSLPGSIRQLLSHPAIRTQPVPASAGAPERARAYGIPRHGAIATHTGDFGPRSGTLRIDYVLPSRRLQVRDSAVFWPGPASAEARFANGSDHHLVWADLVASP